MLGVTFQEVETVRCEPVAEPRLELPTDAVVAVEIAGICGSDLHVYHGRETGIDVGTVLGHEFVGRVVEVGDEVSGITIGERVASPFTTSCGRCSACAIGLTARCSGGELFGWRQQGRGLHGGQAELVRVPLAQTTLLPVPSGLSRQGALLAGDVLSTGYYCADQGEVGPGKTVAVVGCGPVGLMAVLAARHLEAAHVLAIDRLPERLALAEEFGAEAIHLEESDPRRRIDRLTAGWGVDVVLEAVGSAGASRLAVDLLRPGGTLSIVGVHTEPVFAFTPVEAYDRNLTIRIGRCPARHYMERAFSLLSALDVDPTRIFSHRLPLSEAARGYRIFADRSDHCIKVVLEP